MNKLFKGAVAGAAGVALLLGGAGTFALWNTDMPIGDSQTITAGTLAWANPGTGTWLLNGQAVDPSTALLVPGDVLTYTVTGATYTATGDYIAGTIGADWAGLAPGGSGADADFYSNLDVSITVGGTDVTNTTIDLTPGTGVALGTVVVTIGFNPTTTTGTDGQGGTVNLSAFNLTLQQVAHTGQPSPYPTI